MNTDLELYKVFCEVVKYKNISKTAESLYISQSAITQSIQKLESLLGGKVFYRSRTGVELTEEGKHLYEYIKDSIETMNNAENIFSKYINLEKGKIRIAGGNSLVTTLILPPIISFMKKYPDIDVSIKSGLTDSLLQKLSNGEIDIVALNLQQKITKNSNVEIIPLKESSYCFFASKKYIKEHPVKNFKDIENHKLILPSPLSSKRKILNDYCEENNLNLTANYEVSSSSIMKKLVLNDIGIGFTNTENIENIKDDIKILKEIEFDITEEGIAVLNAKMANKATLELIKEIKNYYQQED